MAVPATHNMKYRYLGNSGLLVSRLSFGSFVTFDGHFDINQAYDIMIKAYQGGVNFFDNAEGYGWGKSEQVMGEVIQHGIKNGVWTREDLVVSTKIFMGAKGMDAGPNDMGLNRKHIIEGTKASLKRFGFDYVDVIFCHRSEASTPTEEIVRAMNFVIEQGRALYWGTSEWTSHNIIEACEIADRLGLIRPIVEQPQYHIFERSRVDFDYVNLYKKYKYGLTTWSPLAFGILTGKYSNGIPEGTRLANVMVRGMMQTNLDERIAKADKLKEIADELDCSLAQLTIAWRASNTNVSTVIIGASSIRQLEENLKANEVIDKITPEIKARIDEIAQFVPKVVENDPYSYARTKWL
uniref:NADP-dependent oxidoreductase domain-containing protein n=1 Tax=Globisporangium ultimum (strain ATCC 200006 / CBS 805.95 / DAOM BR144) TaxID=431595 RepID=K3WXH9_GLOUD